MKISNLLYIEYIFRNLEIHLHVNGIQNQDLAEKLHHSRKVGVCRNLSPLDAFIRFLKITFLFIYFYMRFLAFFSLHGDILTMIK